MADAAPTDEYASLPMCSSVGVASGETISVARVTTANPASSSSFLGSNAVLAAAVVASLALHAWLILPGVVGVATRDHIPTSLEKKRTQPTEPDDRSPADLMLGREDSDASTLTWIGYEQYEEHLARLAEVEQAEMTREPAGAPVDPGDGAPAGVPRAETEPQVDTPIEPVDAADPPPADGQTPVEREPLDPPPQPVDEVESEAPNAERQTPVDPAAVAESLRRARELADRMRDAIEVMRDASDELLASVPELAGPARPIRSSETEAQQADQQQEQQDETDQPAARSGQAGRQAGGDPGETGELGDHESDATSTIDVPLDDLQAGRPVAAEGLELQTRRPKFTNLQRLTARPVNPVLAIDFSSQGVPRDVRIKRSSTYRSIDDAIVNSLYQWRAKGERLDKLEKKETLEIVIEVILLGR